MTIITREKMIDCRKELTAREEGTYRVTVFAPTDTGNKWKFVDFLSLEEAQEVYDNVDYYEDLKAGGE